MTRRLRRAPCVMASLLFVLGAAACGDDSEPDTDGGGAGSGGSGPCGAMGEACCNGTACNSGLECQSGICGERGYTTAELYIYVCPDFYSLGCSMRETYAVGSSECYPLTVFEAGQWNATGIMLDANSHYSVATCKTTDCYDCGQPATINTPSQFTSERYCGASWMCEGHECTKPDCPF